MTQGSLCTDTEQAGSCKVLPPEETIKILNVSLDVTREDIMLLGIGAR